MNDPHVDFVVRRDGKEGEWTVHPDEVRKNPGDTVVIKAVGSRDWKVVFDPGVHARRPDGSNEIRFTISPDVPTAPPDGATYKFTVQVDGQVIDPRVIIYPPS